jgi:molecular chaperone GrpE
MNDQEKQPEFVLDAESDDVEILEVVGIDEGAAPPSLDLDDDDDDDDEVVLFGSPGASSSPDDATDEPESAEPASVTDAADDEQFLRLRADYDNLRKRIDRERQDYELYANSSLIGRLLPILDNFERALAVGRESERDPALLEGCVMIYKQLIDELRRQGLKPVDAMGEAFDPQVHDAVATDGESEEPANTVVEELRRGYLFRNRLLRPAMVKVSTNGPDRSGSD